jgi:hypothetical protein
MLSCWLWHELDFSTCNNDSNRRAYIGVDQIKMKKIIVIIDE